MKFPPSDVFIIAGVVLWLVAEIFVRLLEYEKGP